MLPRWGLLCSCLSAVATAIDLDISDPTSIRNVASTIAHGAMSYYKGNTSSDPVMVGDLPEPYYWWQAGALWGAMLDYYHYTGDPTYNKVVIEALLAPVNTGPAHDFNPPEHHFELGNDDLAFWGFAVMSAAERNFPQPKPQVPSWLQLSENIFQSLSSRWNDTHCGGGVLWQVFESNPNGLNYKNSVTNGGLFQLAARLARATGKQDYADWAKKVWDWSVDRGFVGKKFNVYDGAHASDDCAQVNYVAFTYTAGIYLYGAAVMAAHTGDQVWADRAHKILDAAGHFFQKSEKDGEGGILYEPACEPNGKCNHDMKSLKGYLSRFMWQSTYHVPTLKPKVRSLLESSSLAAAKACSGGDKGSTCGQKWYVGGFDGSSGLGQQMCALETIQGLLIDETHPPSPAGEIQVVRNTDWKQRRPPPPKTEDGDEGSSSDGDEIDSGKPPPEEPDPADEKDLPIPPFGGPGPVIPSSEDLPPIDSPAEFGEPAPTVLPDDAPPAAVPDAEKDATSPGQEEENEEPTSTTADGTPHPPGPSGKKRDDKKEEDAGKEGSDNEDEDGGEDSGTKKITDQKPLSTVSCLLAIITALLVL